jgi:hypothetical protein
VGGGFVEEGLEEEVVVVVASEGVERERGFRRWCCRVEGMKEGEKGFRVER